MFIVKTIPSGTAREGPAAGSRHLRCSAIPAVNALPQPAALEAHCRLGRSLPGLSVEGAGPAGGMGRGLLREVTGACARASWRPRSQEAEVEKSHGRARPARAALGYRQHLTPRKQPLGKAQKGSPVETKTGLGRVTDAPPR